MTVMGFLALALALPALGLGRTDRHDDLPARVDALMARLYPPDGPGAVVLVARAGEVLVRGAYGRANLEHDVPMTPDGVFKLASVSKLFTATAVLMLAEEGEVSLDDRITTHLSGAPAKWQPVTLRHLLTHTSGVPELLDREDLRTWIRRDHTVPELIASVAERELAFEPGTASAYSNSNYLLLAALVQEVTGEPYADVVRTRLFEPAGLERTVWGGFPELVPGRVAGYESRGGGFLNEKVYSMTILFGSGDVLSSTEDLHRWLQALFDGAFLPEETLQGCFEPARLTSGEATRFGLGWELDRVRGRRAVLKGGAISGFTHYVLAMPDDGVHVIVLTNRGPQETHRPGRLAIEIAGMLFDR